MDKEKIKDKEWEFKEEREKLIKQVEGFLDKKLNPFIATNIVDAIFLATCEYKDKQCNPPKEVVVHRGLETFRKSFIKIIEEISNNWFGEDDFDNDEIEQIKNKGARNALLIIKNKFDKELKLLIQTFRKSLNKTETIVESKQGNLLYWKRKAEDWQLITNEHLDNIKKNFIRKSKVIKFLQEHNQSDFDLKLTEEDYDKLKSSCSEKDREITNALSKNGLTTPSEKQLDNRGWYHDLKRKNSRT